MDLYIDVTIGGHLIVTILAQFRYRYFHLCYIWPEAQQTQLSHTHWISISANLIGTAKVNHILLAVTTANAFREKLYNGPARVNTDIL